MITVAFFVHAQIERHLLEQEFDDSHVALRTASIQWRLLVLIRGIDIGPIREQQFHDLRRQKQDARSVRYRALR